MSIQKTIVLTHKGKSIISKPFAFGIIVFIEDEQHRYFRKSRREMNEKYGISADNEDVENIEEIKGNISKDIIDGFPDNQIFYRALIKMFEGTELTEEIIDSEISQDELRNAIKKIHNMFYEIDEDVKNV